ncbi:MAG: HAMP domain-containing protein [Oscillospiraceae bacterium]|nr:HAMP domain-containing protein [Oscillospiraceae bacterium]
MKLWLKQTLICLLVIMLAFCACLYFFVVQQTQQMLDDAQNSALQNTNVFCEHLATLDRTSNTGYGTDETTLRALIQYTFSSYAHLLQSKDCSYSLVMDGTYLYNISAYQPMQLLPVDDQVITAQRLVEINGVPLLITARNTTVLNLPITVYTVQEVSDTFARIDTLARNAQLALVACLLLSGILLPLTLRRTLRPLGKLTQVSEEISGGEYSLRSKIKSQDEVGELSASFDHMAETVEQKMSTRISIW